MQKYSSVMDIDTDTLLNLCKMSPECVPISKVGTCLAAMQSESDRGKLISSLTRRKPRSERERITLLYYATTYGIGGVLFVDALGGYKGQRLC
jgi:hypothetical protein